MNNKLKAIILAGLAIVSLMLGIGIGSVNVSPADTIMIIKSYIFDTKLPDDIDKIYYGVVTGIRLPRVVTAFIAGAALSVSGTIMQSVLKNPLASSYGLGVSSGAGLGAAIIMITGLAAGKNGNIILPLFSTIFALISVLAVMLITGCIDKSLSDNTIILAGMVLAMFLNAITNTLASANAKYTHLILLFQLGTFSGKAWDAISVLAVVTLASIIFFLLKSRELDVMTFGEETALTVGVNVKREKWLLIIITALLTGTAVSFVGVIGFVDLIAPHVARRFFGASHRWVIPMSALFGGAFMVLCDLFGRTLASPNEIPAGSITALIGAPFFFYLFLVSRRRKV